MKCNLANDPVAYDAAVKIHGKDYVQSYLNISDGEIQVDDGGRIIFNESVMDITKNKELKKLIGAAMTNINSQIELTPDSKDSLKPLINKLSDITSISEFNSYVLAIEKQTESLYRKIYATNDVVKSKDEKKDGDLTIGEVNFLRTVLDNNHNLQNISDYIYNYYTTEEIENPDQPLTSINNTIAIIRGYSEQLKSKLAVLSKNVLTEELSRFSTIIREDERLKLQKQWREANPGNNNKVIRDEWVDSVLGSMSAFIEHAEKKHINDLLSYVPVDIDAFTLWVADARGTNDHLIQLSTRMLDEVDLKTTHAFIDERNKFLDTYDKWIAKNKHGDMDSPEKVFAKFMIKDGEGKLTNLLKSDEFSDEYIAALSEYYAELSKLNAEKNKLSYSLTDANLSKISIITDDIKALKEVFNTKYKEKKPVSKKVKGGVKTTLEYVVKDKYKANHNMSKEDLEMLKAFNDLQRTSDEQLSNKRDRLRNKLPSIEKHSLTEFLMETDRKKLLSTALDNTFKTNNNDTELSVVSQDSHGNQKHRLALFYRGEATNQSYDLPTIMLANLHMSLNFKHKQTLVPTLKLLGEFMATREVGKRDWKGQVMSKFVNDEEHPAIVKGELSNVYKRFVGLIETRLYSLPEKDHLIAGYSTKKITGAIIGTAAHTMMTMNVLGGLVNFVQGESNIFLAKFQKIWWSNDNALSKAQSQINSDFHNIIDDIGSSRPKSKTNQWMEFLELKGDLGAISANFLLNKDYKKKLNIATEALGTAVYNAPEHYMLSQIMYAVMSDVYPINSKGEYLTRDGVTTDKKLALTINDLSSKGKDGKITIDPRVANLSGKFKKANLQEAITELSQTVKSATAAINGEYDMKNRALMHRHWAGKLAMFMRTWIYRGFQERLGGASTVFAKDTVGKDYEDIDLHLRNFEQSSHRFKEGSYTTALRFITKMHKEFGALGALMGVIPGVNSNGKNMYNNLSDMEKANIMKAMAEMSMFIISVALAAILANLAEGDEDDPKDDSLILWTMAYVMKRNAADFGFFTGLSLNDMLRVLESPTYVTKMMGDGLSILGMIFKEAIWDITPFSDDPWLELTEYKTGKNKGDTKLFHKMLKFAPWLRHTWYADPEGKVNFMDKMD